MKLIILLGGAVLAILILTGSAMADDEINTSNIFIIGYYNSESDIDLSQAIQEFDHITETTDQYIEGILTIWHDNSGGINPGNIYEYEYKNGAKTDTLLATTINVRVKSDGWIVAWLTNDQDIHDLVFWNDAKSNTGLTDTTIGTAIRRISNRIGINYDKKLVNYYSYKYPAADRLLIGGRTVHYCDKETYFFLIPSAATVYKANFLSTLYLEDRTPSGQMVASIKINDDYLFNKESGLKFSGGLLEYARYNKNITDMERDTRHTVYMKSYGAYSRQSTVKSAVLFLYRSG
ncbi:MAG: hypothetical protein C5S45_00535 [Candidatus Methanocomedens sp.]|nr:MAG: hypothetical protein C5S45_00535 [ANME-2 cluster archaeon]